MAGKSGLSGLFAGRGASFRFSWRRRQLESFENAEDTAFGIEPLFVRVVWFLVLRTRIEYVPAHII